MIASPKNAWNAIVPSSSTSRNGYGSRYGTGSIPMSDCTKRYPVMRKCPIIHSWPMWSSIVHRKSGE
jgi:hypothetical protein